MKNHGSLEDFRLVLHGTAEVPHNMKAGPRVYDENYNTVQNERSVRLVFEFENNFLSFFLQGKTSKLEICKSLSKHHGKSKTCIERQ